MIRVDRPNFRAQLNRLSYTKGRDVEADAREFLSQYASHAFTADTIAARIPTAASATQVELVLSENPDQFESAKHNGKLYWWVA